MLILDTGVKDVSISSLTSQRCPRKRGQDGRSFFTGKSSGQRRTGPGEARQAVLSLHGWGLLTLTPAPYRLFPRFFILVEGLIADFAATRRGGVIAFGL